MSKVSELQGAALDWAVAKCEGKGIEFDDPKDPWLTLDGIAYQPLHSYTPTTDWAQGGPIIERDGISMRFSERDARGAWYAVLGPNRFLSPDFEGSGPTPLVAAMRCYVASKLGDEIDLPEELK
jgi:hypothetical protein